MAKPWTEQHIIELIKRLIVEEGGSGSSDDPDDSDVVSDYNYPFILCQGGNVFLIENDVATSTGIVYFGYSGTVASQDAKFPMNIATNFKDILPVGGYDAQPSATIRNMRKLSPLVAVPSGSSARGATGIISPHVDGGSHPTNYACYHLARLGYSSSNIENLLRTTLERLDSSHGSSPGNYYYVNHSPLRSTAYKQIFYIVGTSAIIMIEGMVEGRDEAMNLTFSGVNFSNTIYLSSYYLKFSSINSFITSFFNFLTDENITLGNAYIMISDVIFSPQSIQAATGIRTISTTRNEILEH